MHWLGGRHALPVPLASPHPPPGKHLDSHTGIEPVIASVVRYAATEVGGRATQLDDVLSTDRTNTDTVAAYTRWFAP